MAAAANYAWVNRSSMTFLCRQAFAKLFNSTPDDLDMHMIYDVSHNIAKVRCLTTSLSYDVSHNIAKVRCVSTPLRYDAMCLTTSLRYGVSHNIAKVRCISQHR